ncbi:unnamed protein product [Cuscuta campestris]|uniref:Ribulose bisphosphate carboxylase small subunit, chloroplastic n=2 Tax=Cuscuta sect. Cleistogrammica TaxID=1824901 RepID=A0A484NFT6_9ASTE|nr:hypothetical protein DM860_004876 [Cuscuta australis]VFQ99940.1 unnamed protein product [Cuscuta campestris]
MAASVLSTAGVIGRAAQATALPPFTGLKSSAAFPISKKSAADTASLATNGLRVQCMKVWPPAENKKFETLSYLPDLTDEQLYKQVEYLLRNQWIPCLEFELENPFVQRENHRSPGYYDGRYWTLWKLPMFGCTEPGQVLAELEECKKSYPNAWIRLLGFDNQRQTQCVCVMAHKPASSSSSPS